MKIQYSKRLNEELKTLIAYRTDSVSIERDLTAKIASNKVMLDQSLNGYLTAAQEETKDILPTISKGIQKMYGEIIPEQELTKRMLLLRAVAQGIPTELIANPIVTSVLTANIRFFKAADLANNPYYRDIQIPDVQNGRFHLFNHVMPKNFIMLYDNATVMQYGVALPSICLIEEDILYPVLEEGDKTWMSVDMHEIYTMQADIDRAHGKVLTLGCGMGYFAYMASLKDNVESVTIVEREQAVIDLFQTHILPQMNTKDKIHIIQADAFSFMETLADGEYDYCYADIWDGPQSYMDYLRIHAVGNRLKKTEMQYWLEPNMNAHLLQSFMHWLTNQMVKAQARWTNVLKDPPQNPDALGLFPLWAALCRKDALSTPEQLRAICDEEEFAKRLSNKNLTKLLAELNIK